MKHIKTEGIILKRKNIGEADRLLTLLTPYNGKLKVKAVGVRKISSRRASHVELLNKTRCTLYFGKGMPILTEAESIDHYQDIKEDLKKIGYAYYMCEIMDGLCAENQENPAVYNLLVSFLNHLIISDKPSDLIKEVELKLLSELGFYKNYQFSNTFNSSLFIESILEKKIKTRQILPRLQ